MPLDRRELLFRTLAAAVAPLPLLAAEPDARKIFEAAHEALTGDEPLRDYAYEQATQLEQQGRTLTIQSRVEVLLPDAVKLTIETPNGPTVMAIDGDRGWRAGAAGRQELPADAIALQHAELARQSVLYRPLPADAIVRYREEAAHGGRPADVIELADVGGTVLRLFIDQQTHEAVKRVFVGDAPGGLLAQVEEYLSDYRTVDGFRWPFAKRVVRNGQQATQSKISTLEINRGLKRSELLGA